MELDVVCGMGVEKDALGTFSRKFEGKMYFFCSAECMLVFSKEPLYYLNSRSEEKVMSRDLVCGMKVDESNSPFTVQYKGKTYYFCAQSCKQEFERDPPRFITNE